MPDQNSVFLRQCLLLFGIKVTDKKQIGEKIVKKILRSPMWMVGSRSGNGKDYSSKKEFLPSIINLARLIKNFESKKDQVKNKDSLFTIIQVRAILPEGTSRKQSPLLQRCNYKVQQPMLERYKIIG